MKDLVQRFIGDPEAAKRKTLTADDVTQDEAGLDVLVVRRNLHTIKLNVIKDMAKSHTIMLSSPHLLQTLSFFFCKFKI